MPSCAMASSAATPAAEPDRTLTMRPFAAALVVAALAAAFAAGVGGAAASPRAPAATAATASASAPTAAAREPLDRAALAAEVRRELLHAWEGYRRFAWGH